MGRELGERAVIRVRVLSCPAVCEPGGGGGCALVLCVVGGKGLYLLFWVFSSYGSTGVKMVLWLSGEASLWPSSI